MRLGRRCGMMSHSLRGMDFAIAIRTMVLKNGRAYVQAGAGIVYDSIPANEYQETINKAKSMTKIGEMQ